MGWTKAVQKMVQMTDTEKAALQDAITGIRGAGAKVYVEGEAVLLEATPEQKQVIAPHLEVLSQRTLATIASCLADWRQPVEPGPDRGSAVDPVESSENSPKPANFIPRDGFLARCVRMLAAEGHSQARIARELRLNKRTVTRLLQQTE